MVYDGTVYVYLTYLKECEFVLTTSERFCALPACRANGENRGAVRKISHFSLTVIRSADGAGKLSPAQPLHASMPQGLVRPRSKRKSDHSKLMQMTSVKFQYNQSCKFS